jgi:hypothetical protein
VPARGSFIYAKLENFISNEYTKSRNEGNPKTILRVQLRSICSKVNQNYSKIHTFNIQVPPSYYPIILFCLPILYKDIYFILYLIIYFN